MGAAPAAVLGSLSNPIQSNSIQMAAAAAYDDDHLSYDDDDSHSIIVNPLDKQYAHPSPSKVASLLTLPDGGVVSASNTNIFLWDFAANTSTQIPSCDPNPITAFTHLTSDGRIASADTRGNVSLWDIRCASKTATLHEHTGRVNALACFSSGVLASAGEDLAIRLWDTRNCSVSGILHREHTDVINALTIVQDKFVASGSADATMHIRSSFSSGLSLRKKTEPITTLAPLSHGEFVSGDATGVIRVYDRGFAPFYKTVTPGYNDSGFRILPLSDCNTLVATTAEPYFNVWSLSEKRKTHHCRLPDDHRITALTAINATSFVTGDETGVVRVWNLGDKMTG